MEAVGIRSEDELHPRGGGGTERDIATGDELPSDLALRGRGGGRAVGDPVVDEECGSHRGPGHDDVIGERGGELGRVLDRVDAVREGPTDAVLGVGVRRHPQAERVRLVDHGRELRIRVVAPRRLVADRQHATAHRHLDAVRPGARPAPHEGPARIGTVGDGFALHHRRRDEEVAVPARHVHEAVREHPRSLDDARFERPRERELDVIGREIAHGRDADRQRAAGVREAVQHLLLGAGDERPGQEVRGGVGRVADEMHVRVDEAREHGVLRGPVGLDHVHRVDASGGRAVAPPHGADTEVGDTVPDVDTGQVGVDHRSHLEELRRGKN